MAEPVSPIRTPSLVVGCASDTFVLCTDSSAALGFAQQRGSTQHGGHSAAKVQKAAGQEDEEKRRSEEHQKLASRLIFSAEGGAGFSHRNTKPAAWRGDLQVLEDLEEGEEPKLGRGAATAPRSYTATHGVGCDGFHTKLPKCRIVKRNEGRNCEVAREVGAVWELPATGLHDDVFPRFQRMSRANAPSRLLPTLIRWWEWLRAFEVTTWQERHRVGWDAIDGRKKTPHLF